MSFLYRNCPCCEHKIGKCLFLTRNINHASKHKKDYKCFYCPECKNQISKNSHVLWEPILGMFIFIIIYFLSKITVEYLDLFQKMPLNMKIIPFIFIYLVVFSCLYISYVRLKCHKNSGEKHIEINNGDNQLLDGFLELDKNIKVTPMEKKIVKSMIKVPFYIFIFILFGFLLTLFFK